MAGSVSGLVAAEAAAASVAYDEVRAVGRTVWWLESRPREGGRVALMRSTDDGPPREVTPPEADVGNSLHGYGGGAYAVDNGRIWYVDAADGHIRLVDDRNGPQVVVERRTEDEHLGDLVASDGLLWCVRETGSGDELVEVTPDGSQRVLTSTEGFLGSPRPRAERLAWLRWDADRMPWDGAELLVANRSSTGLTDIERICGGREESVTQPYWDHDGRLWFVSDRTGWWNLYTWDSADSVPVAPMDADIAPPEWEAGYRTFWPLPDSDAVMIVHDGPKHRLVLKQGSRVRPIASRCTSFKPYLAMTDDELVGVAASPSRPPHVFALDRQRTGAERTLAAAAHAGPTSRLSMPEPLQATTVDGQPLRALVYPPAYAGADWRAPLVIRAHPGPTASVSTRLDWHVQFLTSNEFAVVDVDYRGSSGYGRTFRRSLYGRWGTVDVEDCAAVAQALLDAGRTQTGQIFVTGASAGGYTALQAVSRPSVFAGAVARSAIIDPHRWQNTAPRWQRPHAAALLGPAGEVNADRIARAVLLIHGSDDHVAPIADVRQLADALAARGSPCRLIELDAGHKLTAQQSTARALEAELAFYRQLLAT
jgi:dipeptidyl aminopeptidase/acylaminoacyl peptidase